MPPPIITLTNIANVIEPGKKILHIFDVGIKLDDLKLNLLDHARLYLRLIERRHQLGHLIHKGRGHEIVSVIEHQADVAEYAHRRCAKTVAE